MTFPRYIDTLVLLVAARLNVNDVREFYDHVTGISEEDFVRDFRQAQRALRNLEDDQVSPGRRIDFLDESSAVRARRDVARLLEGAKLGPREAVPALVDQLALMGTVSDTEVLRFNPKEGFARWFKRAYDLVGGSSLLKAAIIITSNRDQQSIPDWTLKGS